MDLYLFSDTKRVRERIALALGFRRVERVLIVDAAGPDSVDRGGSAGRLLNGLGIGFSVCDPLTETLPCLDGFDALHMSGGNPFRLLRAARNSDLQAKIEERASRGSFQVYGSSAGAMVVGRDVGHAAILAPRGDLQDSRGFGWIDQLIMPHLDLGGHYGDTIREHVEKNRDQDWLELFEDSFTEEEVDLLPVQSSIRF